MALHDLDTGILLDEIADQLAESGFLCGCAGVLGGFAVGSASADVADADESRVVAGDVGADFVQRSPGRKLAVEMDDEVISDVGRAELPVPSADSVDAVFLALWRGRAVDGDGVQWPHDLAPIIHDILGEPETPAARSAVKAILEWYVLVQSS